MQIKTDRLLRSRSATGRIYWATSILATALYSVVLFFGLVSLPMGTKRTWLLILSTCLVLLAIPLLLRVWMYLGKAEFGTISCAAQIIGVLIVLEFIFCLIQVLSLSSLLYHHPSLANQVP